MCKHSQMFRANGGYIVKSRQGKWYGECKILIKMNIQIYLNKQNYTNEYLYKKDDTSAYPIIFVQGAPKNIYSDFQQKIVLEVHFLLFHRSFGIRILRQFYRDTLHVSILHNCELCIIPNKKSQMLNKKSQIPNNKSQIANKKLQMPYKKSQIPNTLPQIIITTRLKLIKGDW